MNAQGSNKTREGLGAYYFIAFTAAVFFSGGRE
jgi:hypothetical protein